MKKQMTKQMTKYVKYLLLVVVLLGMTTACTKKQELAKEKGEAATVYKTPWGITFELEGDYRLLDGSEMDAVMIQTMKFDNDTKLSKELTVAAADVRYASYKELEIDTPHADEYYATCGILNDQAERGSVVMNEIWIG